MEKIIVVLTHNAMYCQYWFDSGWHWFIMAFFYSIIVTMLA